ncbi:SAP domain-containing ribonucleoprotein-like [Polyodon spathula]|uniref:SAP domain-containing ribonucleoprotein-like n=1 Tax=Polyodon spathula TaxID=7913 RepID=UPI001B7F6075|nr:SAP domain-containing ribonucleoprotein-like [Polyodon spathula]
MTKGPFEIVELKQELSLRNLKTKGSKAELLARLVKAYEDEEHEDSVDEETAFEDIESDVFGTSSKEEELDVLEDEESLQEHVQNPLTPVPQVVSGPGVGNLCSRQSEKLSIKTVASMTKEERLKKRTERFGRPVSDQAKKEARAARFGIPVYGGTEIKQNTVSQEKLKKRKERFGIVMDTTSLLDNQAKKRMRAERFGINLN